MKPVTATSIEYIVSFPAGIQKTLKQRRTVIKKAAPGAEETTTYGIPTLVLNGNLVHFAAFAHHIGFYPGPSGIEAFKKELSVYKGAKRYSFQYARRFLCYLSARQ